MNADHQLNIDELVDTKGQELLSTPEAGFADQINLILNELLGGTFVCAPGIVRSQDGSKSDAFAAVISKRSAAESSETKPADDTAAVIDVCDFIDMNWLRDAHARISAVKRLRKTAVPPGDQKTNVTLGVVVARNSAVPMDVLAEELDRLNSATPNHLWPDMIVVLAHGTINYGVQYPGSQRISGDFLPPAAGAGQSFVPAIYILTVLKPSGTRTFHNFVKFLTAHLFFFSPGAELPKLDYSRTGHAVTFAGYQFNLKAELRAVPRQYYNDRLLPELPLLLQDHAGKVSTAVQFILWQDGGVILFRGKFPLIGFLPFFSRADILKRAHVIPNDGVQISSVLPITRNDFIAWLQRIERQSNLVIRQAQGRFVTQKIADEGTSSPFMARIFLTPLQLRERALNEPAALDRFDQLHDTITSDLVNARSAAERIRDSWAEHVGKILTGEIVQNQGAHIHISESIDKELRREVETFINSAVRCLKTGMQDLGRQFGVEIGFLFKKLEHFKREIGHLCNKYPELADYLERCRIWSEPLLNTRNAVEHEGWKLPRISYLPYGSKLQAQEPLVQGQPVTQFVKATFDRLCCFVEEFTAYCLTKKLPGGISITEIAPGDRSVDEPGRFRITISPGGMPRGRSGTAKNLFWKSSRREGARLGIRPMRKTSITFVTANMTKMRRPPLT
jgi:hypothetical protein